MSENHSGLIERGGRVLETLRTANLAFAASYPGERADRQPVHSVYGGAQLYRAETTQKLGQSALKAFEMYGADPFEFAIVLGLPGAASLPMEPGARSDLVARFAAEPDVLRKACPGVWLALQVHHRVRAKLETEAVEDFRIDFEDGYGARPDEEEDADAVRTAKAVAQALRSGQLPPFIGIRVKTLSEEHKYRAVRTLDHFVTTLVGATGGVLPPNFVITLPKVSIAAQVSAFVELLELLEQSVGLEPGALKLELMIETTQSMVDDAGRAALPALLNAGKGRVRGAHFGTYDYTASANITASQQRMDHLVCDQAKSMMTWSYAGRGIFLSDGATNVMPVGPHRAAADGALSDDALRENRAVVHAAWRLAYSHTRHSLETGFYQGWDLHPAQLPVRFAACYAFFLEGFDAASDRLRNFVERAAQATLLGDVFDDAATGQGLLNYFLRALNCGAIGLSDVERTGLSVSEIQTRSFAKILRARAGLS